VESPIRLKARYTDLLVLQAKRKTVIIDWNKFTSGFRKESRIEIAIIMPYRTVVKHTLNRN
jgi:hypothetical protein